MFLYPWPIILLLSSHLASPWILPKRHLQLFVTMNPTTVAYACMATLIMGWGPLPSWPSRSIPVHVQTEPSLTSRVGTLSLCFSKVQLLSLDLSLECLGENKAWILLHLTNTRCLAWGPLSPTSVWQRWLVFASMLVFRAFFLAQFSFCFSTCVVLTLPNAAKVFLSS